MNIEEKIQNAEQKYNKAELLYRLTGDSTELLLQEKSNFDFFKNEEVYKYLYNLDKDMKEKYRYVYSFYLRYVGDMNLRTRIIFDEKELRKVRKKISVEDYEKKLRELVKLRNRFAQTIGFKNYLEFQYEIYDINKLAIESKLSKEYDELYKKYNKYNVNENKDNIRILNEYLKIENQILIAKETIRDIGMDLNKFGINFHIERNDRKVGAGAAIPISIPNDIHVITNPVEGLGGYASLLMHEIGHAIYFSSIDPELPYALKNTYNNMLDEGVALFFENLIYSEEWFEKYLNMKYPLYNIKECVSIPQEICCMKFEIDMYNNPDESFNYLWKYNQDIFLYNYNLHWSNPHFFVSAPGYFSAYILGEFFARDLKNYFIKNNGKLFSNKVGSFLFGKIFKDGRNLDIEKLLSIIDFK